MDFLSKTWKLGEKFYQPPIESTNYSIFTSCSFYNLLKSFAEPQHINLKNYFKVKCQLDLSNMLSK